MRVLGIAGHGANFTDLTNSLKMAIEPCRVRPYFGAALGLGLPALVFPAVRGHPGSEPSVVFRQLRGHHAAERRRLRNNLFISSFNG